MCAMMRSTGTLLSLPSPYQRIHCPPVSIKPCGLLISDATPADGNARSDATVVGLKLKLIISSWQRAMLKTDYMMCSKLATAECIRLASACRFLVAS